MKVLKFGGSSVADADSILKVIDIAAAASVGEACVVVFSATRGTTDALIAAGRAAERGDDGYIESVSDIGGRHTAAIKKLFPDQENPAILDFTEATLHELENLCEGVQLVRELSPRTLDRILSFGELVSSKIVAARLDESGIATEWIDSRLLIQTDSTHTAATVDFTETNRRISEHFANADKQIYVLPGFIASDASGRTTTLGRGGSDYTAAILAAALGASVLEIWTDVSGMMTADPRYVPSAREIDRLTYREAMELSHFGARVIYPPTIQPVMSLSIPILIKNTFDPEHNGTLIESDSAGEETRTDMIRGITSIGDISVLSLEGSGMVGIPGFSKRLFDSLSRAEINVILITQSSSEHSICVAIEEKHSARAKTVVDREFEYEIGGRRIEPLKVESGFAILALVGDKMKEHTGVSGRMFTTLGRNGINIHAIAQGSSERNISAIISANDVRKAVNTLHEEFFSDGKRQVNVFVAGVGTVGQRLLDQLDSQIEHLANDLDLNLRVAGIANSSRSVTYPDGAGARAAVADLAEAPASTINAFTDELLDLNLRNSIFVDVTASPAVVEMYPKLLRRSVSVVACNKIAASGPFEDYARLKDLAREYGTNFYFETNVGAGLPVIHTLGDLVRSGDRVRRIDAVLSGTLNFVFNNYDGLRPFAEVVREAQIQGYTEPDPRLDLSGTDVARKILILAREAGRRLEIDDVAITPFLPEECLAGTVEDFYAAMLERETHFRALLDAAGAKQLSLKYIASLDGTRASVGLQQIGPDHNFAHLSGKDNAVMFYTDRYCDQPLVIRGAGAGADVTAAGVFADIIRAAR